jgi:hypothetical protein
MRRRQLVVAVRPGLRLTRVIRGIGQAGMGRGPRAIASAREAHPGVRLDRSTGWCGGRRERCVPAPTASGPGAIQPTVPVGLESGRAPNVSDPRRVGPKTCRTRARRIPGKGRAAAQRSGPPLASPLLDGSRSVASGLATLPPRGQRRYRYSAPRAPAPAYRTSTADRATAAAPPGSGRPGLRWARGSPRTGAGPSGVRPPSRSMVGSCVDRPDPRAPPATPRRPTRTPPTP